MALNHFGIYHRSRKIILIRIMGHYEFKRWFFFPYMKTFMEMVLSILHFCSINVKVGDNKRIIRKDEESVDYIPHARHIWALVKVRTC